MIRQLVGALARVKMGWLQLVTIAIANELVTIGYYWLRLLTPSPAYILFKRHHLFETAMMLQVNNHAAPCMSALARNLCF